MKSETVRFVVKAKDETSRVLKGVGGSFGALGKVAKAGMLVAAAGVGLLVAAVGGLIAFLFKAKAAYESWMLNLVKVQRFTGMAAKETSLLAGEMRLSGVQAESGAKGLQFFARNLDKTREAVKKARRGLADLEVGSKDYEEKLAAVNLRMQDAGGAFARLGVSLTDAGGEYRDTADVLADVRDRISEIEDPAKRTAVAMAIFGRGGSEMLPWLTKSVEKMREYAKFVKSIGMEMGEKSMRAFSAYRENQRKLSFAWEAIKINAYAALVPLINKYMPDIIGLISRAAGWLGEFRTLAEKKGWDVAFKEMVPGAKTVIAHLRNARDWWNRNKDSIKNVAVEIGKVLAKFAAIATWCLENKAVVSAVWNVMKDGVLRALGPLGILYTTLSRIKDAMGWIMGNGGEAAKVKSQFLQAGPGVGAVSAHGKPVKPHGGGTFSGPHSGYPAIMHDTETVVSHDHPEKGLKDLAALGFGGGGGGLTVEFKDCSFSAHTPKEIARSVISELVAEQRRAARASGAFA